MSYYLEIPMTISTEQEKAICKKLLIEVMGYPEDIAQKISRGDRFDDTVMVNLTAEEAIKIAQPFRDNGLTVYLGQHSPNRTIGWDEITFYNPQPIKDHYECLARPECRINPDQKYITQEPYVPTPKPQPSKPSVECPYCHSTNTKKISGVSKAGSVALFGLFSQKVRHQWHCNDCKSDF